MDDSFKAKYNRLTLFYHRLNEFKKFTPQTVKTKMKKKIVYNNALNLYNKLSIYFNDYINIKSKSQPEEPIAERVKLRTQKADDKDLTDTPSLEGNYSDEFIDIPDMSRLEGDEEVKEEKGLKILSPNKLLTRLPILLAQIKAGNISYKLKNEIIQILYLCISIIKLLKKFTTI